MNGDEQPKKARKAAGLTQAEAAKIVGITQNGYSYWENGKTKIDNVSHARLAKLYGVTTDYLLGFDNAEKPAIVSDDGLSDLDRELISLLRQLSPEDCCRVKDFAAGMRASRGE